MRLPLALRRRVLAAVEPPPELTRKARGLARTLSSRIRRLALQRGVRVEPRLVGSLAKDTHLRDPLDVDIFVLFSRTTTREALERHGVAIGKRVLRNAQLKYAEHPYVHGTAGGFIVDVVPAYKLKDPTGRLSAVDRTPFHTAYVKRHATAAQRREVRLLKRWLRGIHCYGAETATGGVSGYLAELLILHYGTFGKAIDGMATWEAPVELALEGRPTPMGGPLVFIDPVDASRNAAAAVTGPSFDRLVRAAKAFRKRPRWEFFFPNPVLALSANPLLALLRDRHVVGLVLPTPEGRPETVLPKAQRLSAKIGRALDDEGFGVRHRDVFELAGRRVLWLWELAHGQLAAREDHRGPPANDPTHGARFQEKWRSHADVVREPRIVDGRWTVTLRRRRRTPIEVIGPRVPDLLAGFEFPEAVRRAARLEPGRELVRDAHRLALTQFLRRRDPWEN